MHERQMLLCCASLTPSLRKLLPELHRADVVSVTVGPPLSLMAACSNELVSQRAVFAEEQGKQAALGTLVRSSPGLTLVVCSTRKRCELVLYLLQGEGVTALDGNLSDKLKPKEREAALQSFSSGKTRVLLVCDAALKELGLVGLGVPIAHVIGFDLPGMEARRRTPTPGIAAHARTARARARKTKEQAPSQWLAAQICSPPLCSAAAIRRANVARRASGPPGDDQHARRRHRVARGAYAAGGAASSHRQRRAALARRPGDARPLGGARGVRRAPFHCRLPRRLARAEGWERGRASGRKGGRGVGHLRCAIAFRLCGCAHTLFVMRAPALHSLTM